jgi:hypothetical protein
MKLLFILVVASIFATSCSQNQKDMKPYVLEVTSFKYNANVNADTFWTRDAEIEADYTSKQVGFISRESGYSESNNEVIVLVRWKTQADAAASMKKFMTETSVQDYAAMIDGPTMKMARYNVK